MDKTNNKEKILKIVLWKRYQLTYLLKVNQLISNSQRLKFVKKNRSFNLHWYSKFLWIHYSTEKDAAFCFSCLSAEKKGHIQCAIEKILFLFQGDSEIGKRLVNSF